MVKVKKDKEHNKHKNYKENERQKKKTKRTFKGTKSRRRRRKRKQKERYQKEQEMRMRKREDDEQLRKKHTNKPQQVVGNQIFQRGRSNRLKQTKQTKIRDYAITQHFVSVSVGLGAVCLLLDFTFWLNG